MSGGRSLGTVLWRLHHFLAGATGEGRLYECRRCGQSFHSPRQDCPECGAAEIAQYEF
jgi:uncharacterized OB-fold protein